MNINKTYNTGETDAELKVTYNQEGSLMRTLQYRMLEMLLYFDRVCKHLGIVYYIDAGTCLGAVRHGGFIPWDDDLDVVIDRKDYPKLCDYMIKHPHPQFVLHNHETDSNYYWGWAKIRDLKSKSTYHGPYKDVANQESILKYTGVAMDIFVYSDHVIPVINYVLHGLHKHITLKHLIKKHPTIARGMYFLFFKVLKPIANVIGLFFSRKRYCGHDYIGNNVVHRFLKDKIFPLKPIMFEGYEFMIPHDHEYFLSTYYNRWHDLPPKATRGHHGLEYTLIDDNQHQDG